MLWRRTKTLDSLVSLKDYDFDVKVEKVSVERTLVNITEAIIDFAESGKNNQDHVFQRIRSRITHIANRELTDIS